MLVFSSVFVLMCCYCVSIMADNAGPNHGKVVVCYIGTWSVYRPGKGSYSIEDFDPTLCTHVVYSFAGLDEANSTIKSLDAWQDTTDDFGKGGFERLTKLKLRYPHLKVSIAIGGWNEGSEKYSRLAADGAKRAKFISSVLDFLRKYKFDGLDLDWEFPADRGGVAADKQNFVLLVRELRAAFEKHKYLLTAALGVGKARVDKAYDVRSLSKHLDYIHLMCYDYHGTWDSQTGANAPLASQDELNVEYSVKYMLKLGADPAKLVLGVPLYGRTFILNDKSHFDASKPRLGQPSKSEGFQGPLTRENGFFGYNEICMELQNSTSGWKRYWDEESKTPFIVNDDRMITYDDEESLEHKVRFAMERKLAGIMVWSVDTDDFKATCAEVNARYHKKNSPTRFSSNYPLMRTINEVLADTTNEIDLDEEDSSAPRTTHFQPLHISLLLGLLFI